MNFHANAFPSRRVIIKTNDPLVRKLLQHICCVCVSVSLCYFCFFFFLIDYLSAAEPEPNLVIFALFSF